MDVFEQLLLLLQLEARKLGTIIELADALMHKEAADFGTSVHDYSRQEWPLSWKWGGARLPFLAERAHLHRLNIAHEHLMSVLNNLEYVAIGKQVLEALDDHKTTGLASH